MNIPTALLTYNRPEYLKQALKEHRRVGTPLPIYIFDDGSDNDEQRKLLGALERDDKYLVFNMQHVGLKKAFVEVGKILKELGFEHYIYVEDDVSFCINWYAWSMKALESLCKNYLVDTLALYSARIINGEKVLKYIYKNTDAGFHGLCAAIVNTRIIEKIEDEIAKLNPDIAILHLSHNKLINLFVVFPNLAQHIGIERTNIKDTHPIHKSLTFLGNDKDALEELR